MILNNYTFIVDRPTIKSDVPIKKKNLPILRHRFDGVFLMLGVLLVVKQHLSNHSKATMLFCFILTLFFGRI